jgi:uncharacterized delta-60 repeat protein
VALGVLVAALGAGRALAAAGQLDPSFSGDGRALTRFPGGTGDDDGNAVAVQSGKVVVVGTSKRGVLDEFAIARYNPNGSLDRTFSGDGRRLTSFPGATGIGDVARAVAIENGKIVVAGYSEQPGFINKFAIARYNPNGSIDKTFSGDGRVLTRFPGANGNDEAFAMAIENGKIVVAGTSAQATDGREFALARYKPNGSLDRSFSGDGRRLSRFPGGTGDDEAIGLAIENGKIVAAGASQQAGGVNWFALARYNPNGSLDTSFSGDGRRLTRFPGATGDEVASAVAIENGKIVAAGHSGQATGRKVALARYKPNGSLDTSFSGDGRVLTRFPGATGDDEAFGVAIENVRIVAAGASKQGTSTFKFALARYNANGSLDKTFSGDGRQLTSFPGTTGHDGADAVAIENGRIVAAGFSSQTAGGNKFAVARYLGG